jgi:hypothetical protein
MGNQWFCEGSLWSVSINQRLQDDELDWTIYKLISQACGRKKTAHVACQTLHVKHMLADRK